MSHRLALNLEPSLVDMAPTQKQPVYGAKKELPQKQTNPYLQPAPADWIPPPALLATVNSDAIDLNDEIFFNYNAMPSYTTSASDPEDPFTFSQDVGVSLLSLLTANVDYSYSTLQQQQQLHDLAASPLMYGDCGMDTHYSHRRRFLLAAEQLSRMSLRAPSTLKLPSPDMCSVLTERAFELEERTVNPRHLLASMSSGGNAGSVPSLAGNILDLGGNPGPNSSGQSNGKWEFPLVLAQTQASRNQPRYVLPLLVLSPALLTFFSRKTPLAEYVNLTGAMELDPVPASATMSAFLTNTGRLQNAMPVPAPAQETSALNNPLNPYVMNDECVSAITYWLNNTADLILQKHGPDAGSRARNSSSNGHHNGHHNGHTSGHTSHNNGSNNGGNSANNGANGSNNGHGHGVQKPGWNRRNSIHILSPRTEDGLAKAVRALSNEQKRRRRKSLNTSSIPEGMTPAHLSVNVGHEHVYSHAQTQVLNSGTLQADRNRRSLEVVPMAGLMGPPHGSPMLTLLLSLSLSLSLMPMLKQALKTEDIYDAMDISVPNKNDPAKHNGTDYLSHAHLESEPGDSEPKPFPCPDCEKQFKRLEHLKRHMRSVHSDIRPFHCKYCEKKFLRSDNLAQHLKTHFKLNANGTTLVIYGVPQLPGRGGGKKKSTGDLGPVFS